MKVSRRTFVKGSAATVGGLVASQHFGGLELLVPRSAQAAALTEELVPTTCWLGKQDCGILARRINGRVVKLEGHPDHPRNRGRLCPKGQAQIMGMYDYNRVKRPLIRTNEKGVSGKWRQASWDETLTLVAARMNEARKKDKRLLVWQKGRSKAEGFYDTAFVKASGATKLHHGAFCSDAGYRGCEYTTGVHGVLHPDFRYCNYLLAWGWNLTNAGGNKLCWLTWPQELVQAKGDIDIYLDLCEKAGILYGKDGYLDQLNKALGLKLDINKKPTVREIFEHWARSEGIEEGVAYFEKKGVKNKGKIAATKKYGYATKPAFGGALHRLYSESLLRIQSEMKAKGSDKVFWQDYTALPTWRTLTLEASPSTYDLYLTSFKQMEFKQSRTPIPLMWELSPRQYVEMNTKTARARGIGDGDEVWVESHNAVTGEVRKVKTKARLVEGLMPDTVALSHHYGMWTHPWAKDQGPTPNTLFPTWRAM